MSLNSGNGKSIKETYQTDFDVLSSTLRVQPLFYLNLIFTETTINDNITNHRKKYLGEKNLKSSKYKEMFLTVTDGR